MNRLSLLILGCGACVYDPVVLDEPTSPLGKDGDAAVAGGDAEPGGDPNPAGDPTPIAVSCPVFPSGTHDGTAVTADGYVTNDGTHAFAWDNTPLGSSSLQAHWPLDGTGAVGSGDLITDTVGGYSLSAHGDMTRVAAHINEGIELDGVTTWLGGDDILKITSPVTVMAWVRAETAAPAVVVGRETNYQLAFENGGPVFKVWTSLCSSSFSIPGPPLALGRWYHVAGVFTGEKNLLYVNGSLVASQPLGAVVTLCDSTSSFLIGGAPGGDRLFQGDIDEVTVWSEALAAQRIANIYRGQAAHVLGIYTSDTCDAGEPAIWDRFTPVPSQPSGKPLRALAEDGYAEGNLDMQALVGLWHLEENSAGIASATDDSAHANHGNVTGSVRHDAGKLGGGFRLDGTSGVHVPGSASLANLDAITAIAWIRRDARENPGSEILLAMPGVWALSVADDHRLVFRAAFSTLDLVAGTVETLAPETWTQVAVTWKVSSPLASDVALSVDGKPATAPTQEGAGSPLGASNTGFVMGASVDSPNGFSGVMDEVALLDRRLSEEELASVYSRAATRIAYQVAVCDHPDCPGAMFFGADHTPQTAFSELTNLTGGPAPFALTGVPAKRYFRFRAVLESDRLDSLPELTGFSVEAARP